MNAPTPDAEVVRLLVEHAWNGWTGRCKCGWYVPSHLNGDAIDIAHAEHQAGRLAQAQVATDPRPWEVTHDSSGRPSSERDGPCVCDYNPETTEGPVEDCPFHGRPYGYWVDVADRLAQAQAPTDAREALARALRDLADDFDSNVDWSAGRNNYGDNEAWESAARQVRALAALSPARPEDGAK